MGGLGRPPQGYPDQPDRNPRVELGRGAEATGGDTREGPQASGGAPSFFPPSPRGGGFLGGGGCGSRVICAEMSGACAGPPRPGRRHRGGSGPGTRVGWDGGATQMLGRTHKSQVRISGRGNTRGGWGNTRVPGECPAFGGGEATGFRTRHARESLLRGRPLSRCPHMSGVPTRIFRGERFAYRYPQGGGVRGGTPGGVPMAPGGTHGRSRMGPGEHPGELGRSQDVPPQEPPGLRLVARNHPGEPPKGGPGGGPSECCRRRVPREGLGGGEGYSHRLPVHTVLSSIQWVLPNEGRRGGPRGLPSGASSRGRDPWRRGRARRG